MSENPNLPADRAPTPGERQRQRMETLLTAVDQRSAMLRTLLEDTGISFERFVEVIRRALIKNPDLMEADTASVIEACINAATDGLLPDGREGALVIYNVKVSKRGEPDRWGKKANWQPMYAGLLKIAYASGNFRSIECRTVYDGDFFEYDLGDEPYIKHRPKSRPAGAAVPAIVAAYAVAKTVNGGVFREVFEGADIAKVNAVSKATSGPAKGWAEEMARKGPLRRLWKFLPKTDAMSRIVERDNEGFDLSALPDAESAPVAARRLAPGFAPPPAETQQITQGADIVVDTTLDAVDDNFTPVEPGREVKEGPAVMYVDPGPPGTFGTLEDPAPEPAAQAFEKTLAAATSWLNVKQALKTFAKTELGAQDRFHRLACNRAWLRMCELRAEGKDKTDFISDPLLFECWLMGADPEPDADAVAGNWAIVQVDKAFEKLPEDDKARITQRVGEALAESDGQ